MQHIAYFKLFWLVCIAVGSLPGSTSDSEANTKNKLISNNVPNAVDEETKKDSILGNSIIPTVRNTWTRSRAMLEKLWSAFRASSGEQSNRNSDLALSETPLYPKTALFANDNEYYPPYLNPTNRIPNKRYSRSSQTYGQHLPMPHYKDRFSYPQQFLQDSFYQNEFASPYIQEPYRQQLHLRTSYVQPLVNDDTMWSYQNEPTESNFQIPYYNNVPPRFYYRNHQMRTAPTEFTDFYDQF